MVTEKIAKLLTFFTDCIEIGVGIYVNFILNTFLAAIEGVEIHL